MGDALTMATEKLDDKNQTPKKYSQSDMSFEAQLSRQTCPTCHEKKSTAKCNGHANTDSDDSGESLDAAPKDKENKHINLKATPVKKSDTLEPKPTVKQAEKTAAEKNKDLLNTKNIGMTPELIKLLADSRKLIEFQRDTESSILTIRFETNPKLSSEQKSIFKQTINDVWADFTKPHPKFSKGLVIEEDARGNITVKMKVPNEPQQLNKLLSMLMTRGLLIQADISTIQQKMQRSYPSPFNNLSNLKLTPNGYRS
jgi:hypothetical protein